MRSPTHPHTLTLRRAEGPSTGRSELRWPTTVRLSWDSRALRIHFECADDRAWATHTERDAPLWQEEVVEVFLAPGSADPTVYYELEVNPLGALFDARVHSPELERSTMKVDLAWDWPGIGWRVESQLRESESRASEDWSTELELPWSGLDLPSTLPRLWRANFYRVERPDGPERSRGGGSTNDEYPDDEYPNDEYPNDEYPNDEYSAWSPTMADPPDFHRPRYFGLLVLDDASPLDSEAESAIRRIRDRGLPVARIERARE